MHIFQKHVNHERNSHIMSYQYGPLLPWSCKSRNYGTFPSVGERDFRFGWRLALKWMASLEVDVQCHVPMEPRRLRKGGKKCSMRQSS